MELLNKIIGNHKLKLLIALSLFIVIAGFLLLNTAGTSYAQGGEVQDPFGLTDPTGGIARASDAAQNASDACSVFEKIKNPFNIVLCALHSVLQLVGVFLSAAATLFGWVVQVGNMNAVLNAGASVGGTGGSVIYKIWTQVRDLLNIAFILVLLFSAFATIFQVEKYNYKKLLLNLVLMALLVNFSFPIARFIIDISNVMMYTLIRNLFASRAGDVFGDLASSGNLSAVVTPKVASAGYLIAAIVFTFILAITLLAVAVMFIVRMVALAILIIFSPIAFVGAIIPGAGASYANKWWENLFKYAFFGPIMIFMIYIAKSIIDAMGGPAALSSFTAEAAKHSAEPNVIGVAAFFSIPIVILWVGMSTAQTMGIAGAATVMGAAQKTGRWAGKKFSGYNAIKRQKDDYVAIKKREKEEELKHKPHIIDRALARLGDPKAQERVTKKHKDKNKDDIDKGAKNLVDSGDNTDTLAQQMNTNFSAPPPDTKDEKIEHAKTAAAYLKQDSDERKMHIQNTLTTAGGVAGSDLQHIMDAPAPTGLTGAALSSYASSQAQSQWSAQQIATAHTRPTMNNGLPTENDLRNVAAFINNQMKRKVNDGANAT